MYVSQHGAYSRMGIANIMLQSIHTLNLSGKTVSKVFLSPTFSCLKTKRLLTLENVSHGMSSQDICHQVGKCVLECGELKKGARYDRDDGRSKHMIKKGN